MHLQEAWARRRGEQKKPPKVVVTQCGWWASAYRNRDSGCHGIPLALIRVAIPVSNRLRHGSWGLGARFHHYSVSGQARLFAGLFSPVTLAVWSTSSMLTGELPEGPWNHSSLEKLERISPPQ